MRHRLPGAIAATAIAAAALVGCAPPHENPSDIKVTDQENPTHSFSPAPATGSEDGETSGEDGTGAADGTAEGSAGATTAPATATTGATTGSDSPQGHGY